MKPKFEATFYTPPSLTSPKRMMFKEFYGQENKIAWLKDNKERLEKQYDINVIELINAHMNDNWPHKRAKKEAA